MTELATNLLSYGDRLDILRSYLPESAVHLVDIDASFNSNRDESGSRFIESHRAAAMRP